MKPAEILDKAFPPEHCSEVNIQAYEDWLIHLNYSEPIDPRRVERVTSRFTINESADQDLNTGQSA